MINIKDMTNDIVNYVSQNGFCAQSLEFVESRIEELVGEAVSPVYQGLPPDPTVPIVPIQQLELPLEPQVKKSIGRPPKTKE